MSQEIINQIKQLFNMLSPEDKDVVRKDLNEGFGTVISSFVQRHQKTYGHNPIFTVRPVESSTSDVIVDLEVSFGDFTGSGKNQKLAKFNAIEKANASTNAWE
jgi:Tfp pilus assembly pilus retraction ATPase PilT